MTWHDSLDDRFVCYRPLAVAAFPLLILLMGSCFVNEAIQAQLDRAKESLECVTSGGAPVLSGKALDHHIARCKR